MLLEVVTVGDRFCAALGRCVGANGRPSRVVCGKKNRTPRETAVVPTPPSRHNRGSQMLLAWYVDGEGNGNALLMSGYWGAHGPELDREGAEKSSKSSSTVCCHPVDCNGKPTLTGILVKGPLELSPRFRVATFAWPGGSEGMTFHRKRLSASTAFWSCNDMNCSNDCKRLCSSKMYAPAIIMSIVTL